MDSKATGRLKMLEIIATQKIFNHKSFRHSPYHVVLCLCMRFFQGIR